MKRVFNFWVYKLWKDVDTVLTDSYILLGGKQFRISFLDIWKKENTFQFLLFAIFLNHVAVFAIGFRIYKYTAVRYPKREIEIFLGPIAIVKR